MDNLNSVIIVLIALSIYIEWYYFTKKYDKASISEKALYTIIDSIHIIVMYSVIYLGYLIINGVNYVNNLIILNSLWFLIILLFLHYKRCILTIMSADAIGGEDILFSDPRKRAKLLFGLMTPEEYEQSHYRDADTNPTEKWMKGNQLPVAIVMMINFIVLHRLNVA
tara:strand:- start:4813 stop:5313 length:501 start_codon:yes stop_codon:yes gene_type:complete